MSPSLAAHPQEHLQRLLLDLLLLWRLLLWLRPRPLVVVLLVLLILLLCLVLLLGLLGLLGLLLLLLLLLLAWCHDHQRCYTHHHCHHPENSRQKSRGPAVHT